MKDRLWSKIQGWSSKCLSKAGKAVLLRNVAQAVPSYAMSCFLIPKSLCTELERMMNSFWWGSKNNGRKGIKWLSWTNMSMSKSLGGLGFRDLYGFNLALLGKQCWNLLNNPNSLVARVFKARYYNNSSLFEASIGGGVSFIWSGLWKAKEALKKGYKWVLGDGKTIRAFEDPWIRGKENYKVKGMYDANLSEIKACDLYIPGVNEWDTYKVNNLFINCDANAILAMHVPRNQVPDRLAWMHIIDGKYTVKSGYRYWHSNYSECREGSVHKGWIKLWNLEVPSKVKVFLWRICRNNIPVRYVLRGRGVNTTITCPMCEVDIEHLFHIFFDCKFAKDCWSTLRLNLNSDNTETCGDWVLQCLEQLDHEKAVNMVTVLWGIWTARNMKVWEQQKLSPEIAMQWSTKQILQRRDAQKMRITNSKEQSQNQGQRAARWNPPEEGVQDFSCGMILRNHQGGFCKARVVRQRGEVTAFEGEIRGMLAAIRWAGELNVSNVLFESDSMLTVQALNSNRANYLEVGTIIQECRNLLEDRPDFRVSYVRKQVNIVAHLLARVPCMVGCFHDFSSPPQIVWENIVYDASLN